MTAAVLAIDGGGSKTDVALVAADGSLLASARGGASNHQVVGPDAALHGGRDRVAKALLAHPLVGQYDLAQQLTDLLLAENAKFLPWARGQ